MRETEHYYNFIVAATCESIMSTDDYGVPQEIITKYPATPIEVNLDAAIVKVSKISAVICFNYFIIAYT
jgi:hypothetical protein